MGCVFASRVAEGLGTTFRASLFSGETNSRRCWLYCMFRVTACSRLPTRLDYACVFFFFVQRAQSIFRFLTLRRISPFAFLSAAITCCCYGWLP